MPKTGSDHYLLSSCKIKSETFLFSQFRQNINNNNNNNNNNYNNNNNNSKTIQNFIHRFKKIDYLQIQEYEY